MFYQGVFNVNLFYFFSSEHIKICNLKMFVFHLFVCFVLFQSSTLQISPSPLLFFFHSGTCTRNILDLLILSSTSLNFPLLCFHLLIFFCCILDNFLRLLHSFSLHLFTSSVEFYLDFYLSENFISMTVVFFIISRNSIWFFVKHIWTILIVSFSVLYLVSYFMP